MSAPRRIARLTVFSAVVGALLLLGGVIANGSVSAFSAAKGGDSGNDRPGACESQFVDRPGLGYADDYTPWLVDAPIGALVPAEAVGVADDGVLAVVAA